MYLIDMFHFVTKGVSAGFEPVTSVSLEKPLELSFVMQVQRGLLGMAREGAGTVPDDVAAATRDVHHRALSQFDSLYAGNIVRGFNAASASLGLGLQESSYRAETQARLVGRVADDLRNSLFLAERRIHSVQSAFHAMGAEFTADHRDHVAEGIYDYFDTKLRMGPETIHETLRSVDYVLERMDHGMKHPLLLPRML